MTSNSFHNDNYHPISNIASNAKAYANPGKKRRLDQYEPTVRRGERPKRVNIRDDNSTAGRLHVRLNRYPGPALPKVAKSIDFVAAALTARSAAIPSEPELDKLLKLQRMN